MNQLSDSFIIQTVAEDVAKGFSLLVKRFKEPLYWHVRRIVEDHQDAEDALQETFIKLYRSAEMLPKVLSLTAWVYRIATNEALRLVGRRAPAAESLSEPSASAVSALFADEYIDYSDIEAVKLKQAMDSLPQKQKLVFSLRYYDDLPYEEIARIADTSVTAAKVSYHIARNKVIKHLGLNA